MTVDDSKLYASDFGSGDDSGDYDDATAFDDDEGEGLDMVIDEEEVVIETGIPTRGSFETGYEPPAAPPAPKAAAPRASKPKPAKKATAKAKPQPAKKKAKAKKAAPKAKRAASKAAR